MFNPSQPCYKNNVKNITEGKVTVKGLDQFTNKGLADNINQYLGGMRGRKTLKKNKKTKKSKKSKKAKKSKKMKKVKFSSPQSRLFDAMI